jgi:hypothetical protein
MFEEEDQRMDKQKLLSSVQLYVIADRKKGGGRSDRWWGTDDSIPE